MTQILPYHYNTATIYDSCCITLIDTPKGSDARNESLCISTEKLLYRYPHCIWDWNAGIVWGRVFPLHVSVMEKSELTFNISVPWLPQPLPHKTMLNRTVQSLVEEVFNLLDMSSSICGQYLVKLCDSEEYLRNEEILGFYESIRFYQKFGLEVPVRVIQRNSMENLLARDCASNVNNIIKEVRSICNLLCGISTSQLEQAIGRLRTICPVMLSPEEIHECETAVVILQQTLEKLLNNFFENFNSDVRVRDMSPCLTATDVDLNSNILQLNLATLYKLQPSWLNSFDFFSISCSVTYCRMKLAETVVSENISTALALGNTIHCNRQVVFPVPYRQLPYEAMLAFRLQGSKNGKNPELLCWAVLPLFSKKILVRGTVILSMSMLVELTDPPCPALSENHRQTTGVILQLEFPETKQWQYERPVALPGSVLFSTPCEDLQKRIVEVSQKQCLALMTENEKAFLWNKRNYCNESNSYLHLVLGCAPQWQPTDLTEIYTILDHWHQKGSADALFLLCADFQDQTLRRVAVQHFERVTDSELEDYLPQLVQALKMEWELDGPLTMLLLERSLCSVRIAHQLYWLLVDAQEDAHYKCWLSKILASLKHCCGRALMQELEREHRLVSLLTEVAEKVHKADKAKRKDILKREKWKIKEFFIDGTQCRLPLNPAVLVKGVDIDACKFFSSNAAPLGVSFITADPMGKCISVICKTGDNLQQDMLVLQIVRVMDRLWQEEGLDMCMVTYTCISTGKDQGLVEVVPEAVTLGKIQQEWGLGGALREDTLEKWFHMRNNTKEDYEAAVMNFLHSCAGWCVATFILGICDRHNDNIMLKHTGHMFHIDFGKFMGNAQKFANIKRDRTPFIFTSEMQHFITGGGENPQRFHRFVELCCEAYNSLRRRTALVLSLLQMMLGAGMPEMKDTQDLQYVHNNLRPQDTELEATSYFTKKIKESMESLPVKLNFLIHNMVQLSSEKQPGLLAAVKKTSSSTNIQEAMIQKYTVKGRHVIYELRVTIEDGYLISEKRYGQFEMIHKQLQRHFIESTLPKFPSWFTVSFTPSQKMSLLNTYLKELFEGPCKGNEYVCGLFLDGPITPIKNESDLQPNPQIQLYLSYKDLKLSVMIKHLKNIRLSNGSCPDAYVVTRLRPDPYGHSKKKTKVVRNNNNPTFNELIEYRNVLSLHGSVLEVMVKSKKAFVAAANIVLAESVLDREQWFQLGNNPI
ncbi:phosphatidylinositol 4-phosphate 3-kinase C2 domain-containing subunit gamma [Electrophorus electricus]|uniref:phosphatidylinositol 4-phosphate 3-kinase C2 domain-containing subunit gamma n=1 Tax=Electrophorus electricus TaxID=8005 RepID=UPI0015CF9C9A|nr:phosphatidylinositol 4-phosphate 3-kinase C2 domain-containing subunit gamma [Electrophorus electricus]